MVEALPELPKLLDRVPRAITTLPPFNERVTDALRRAYEGKTYRAEQVFMHYLRALGFHPHFWRFCHVARHRLGVLQQGATRRVAVTTVQMHMC